VKTPWSNCCNGPRPARIGAAREPIANLDRLPMPALDLLPRRRYRALAVAFPFAALVGSRGCPYHCGYCSQVYAGGAYREHSAARVVAEMERAVRQFGAREIVFFDESFTVNQRRVREICSLLLAKPWRVAFNVRTRADLLERETLVALRDAGCRGVHVGVESGSPRVQALMNKNLDLARTAATLAEARALGLETRGYFMLGYPGETRAEIDETLRFALTTPLDWASFTIVTPHPGTGIYQDALADGRFTADYWREYTLGRATRAPQPFTSPEYDEGTLERLLREVYRRFYLRPGLLTRKLFSRRTWGQAAGWLATLWALRRRRGRDRTALA
jgi:radical SAM superfamily enzyme YgiQ (UPF0313 family)